MSGQIWSRCALPAIATRRASISNASQKLSANACITKLVDPVAHPPGGSQNTSESEWTGSFYRGRIPVRKATKRTPRPGPAKCPAPELLDLMVWPDSEPDPATLQKRHPTTPSRQDLRTEPRRGKGSAARKGPDPTGSTKTDAMIALMKRRQGATIAELRLVSGWQPHSIRGAIFGAIARKRGWVVSSRAHGADRAYRVRRPTMTDLMLD